jgi:hypothetical protein
VCRDLQSRHNPSDRFFLKYEDAGRQLSNSEGRTERALIQAGYRAIKKLIRQGKLVQISRGNNRTRCANYYRCLYPAPG